MPANGRFPLPNGVFARALPDQQNLSHVDAYNLTVQREISSSLSAEIAYVGNRGQGFFGDNPAADANAPTIVGYPDVPRDQRRPFARFGWTQGIDYFGNTGKSRYNSLQAKVTKRWSGGYSLLTHYTLQSHENNGAITCSSIPTSTTAGQLHPQARVRAGGKRGAALRQGAAGIARTRRATEHASSADGR